MSAACGPIGSPATGRCHKASLPSIAIRRNRLALSITALVCGFFFSYSGPLRAEVDQQSLSALHEYVQQIGASSSDADSPHSTSDAARAHLSDPAFAALREFAERLGSGQPAAPREYVQTIDPAASSPVSPHHGYTNTVPDKSMDVAYGALREFAERINSHQPAPRSSVPKLAEADNMMDALRDMFKGGGAPRSAPLTPRGPAAGGSQPSAPIDAPVSAPKSARPVMRPR